METHDGIRVPRSRWSPTEHALTVTFDALTTPGMGSGRMRPNSCPHREGAGARHPSPQRLAWGLTESSGSRVLAPGQPAGMQEPLMFPEP